MASNWYVSSVAYTAVTQWSASTTFATGAIVRQLAAPAVNSERCFRVTAGGGGSSGGSEPVWVLTNNGTTTDGALTWTECTGQEAHQHDNGVTNTWTAPAARLGVMNANGKTVITNGDTVFFSSDHAETQSGNLSVRDAGTVAAPNFYLSVSRTSTNLPPTGTEILAGASIAATGTATYNLLFNGGTNYWYGLTFDASGTTGAFVINPLTHNIFDTCTIKSSATATPNSACALSGGDITWRNTNFSLTSSNGEILCQGTRALEWIGGTFSGNTSGTLFGGTTNASYCSLEVRGVDLSSCTGIILGPIVNSNFAKALFANCKINASATLVTDTSVVENVLGNAHALTAAAEFINCSSGNNSFVNTTFKFAGSISTETTITRTNGATDGVQKVSAKMVSNSTAALISPLIHDFFTWNTTTGTSKAATIEFISSATLNNDEIWGELEYLGDAGDCKSLLTNNYRATVLTTHAAQTSSSVPWDSSPATPQKQKLSISFTPQKVGLVRIRVYLAKASTTVYVDPMLQIS